MGEGFTESEANLRLSLLKFIFSELQKFGYSKTEKLINRSLAKVHTSSTLPTKKKKSKIRLGIWNRFTHITKTERSYIANISVSKMCNLKNVYIKK